jgi:hypothetical protein
LVYGISIKSLGEILGFLKTKKIMKTSKRYNVISPDGFFIERVATYKSRKEAIAAFEVWKKRYVLQGYYSSNNGRIPLEELADFCRIVEV